MTVESIERDFRDKVSAQIRLAAEGLDRFRVFTPSLFDDGDHLAVVLRRESTGWVLSDEAHTYMHLTYDIDEKDLERRQVRNPRVAATDRCRSSSVTNHRSPGAGAT